MFEVTDCRHCRHSDPSALGMGQLNCKAGRTPIPTNYARSRHGDCKPSADQFEPKPWRPDPVRGNEE